MLLNYYKFWKMLTHLVNGINPKGPKAHLIWRRGEGRNKRLSSLKCISIGGGSRKEIYGGVQP